LHAPDRRSEPSGGDRGRTDYVLNGAIFLVQRLTLLKRRSLYADLTYALVMPAERSLDVDTPWDLHVADLALRFPFAARK
jgi:CMP-N-acetylneuraminic acid synthetase